MGPLIFRGVYKATKNGPVHGAFWLLGTALFLVSIIGAVMLPEKEANSRYAKRNREEANRSKMIRVDEDKDEDEEGRRASVV
jgi:hypothetical protein